MVGPIRRSFVREGCARHDLEILATSDLSGEPVIRKIPSLLSQICFSSPISGMQLFSILLQIKVYFPRIIMLFPNLLGIHEFATITL
jgi:hypothetical protein